MDRKGCLAGPLTDHSSAKMITKEIACKTDVEVKFCHKQLPQNALLLLLVIVDQTVIELGMSFPKQQVDKEFVYLTSARREYDGQ